MNKRFLPVLLFAFVVAGLFTLVFYRFAARRMSSEPKQTTTQIYVAARDLKVGMLVNDADITQAAWPGSVPPNAVLKKDDIVGRGITSAIYRGEPILSVRLATAGAGGGLAAMIPPGMRAVAVRVNDITGVAGFVTPGARVDILISGRAPNAREDLGTLSKTLLQNIQVLSAGHNIERQADGKPVAAAVVNLLVTPEQAEVLSLASSETKIQLVLRNPVDAETAKTNGAAVAQLFSGQKYGITDDAPKPRPRATIKPAVLVQPVREQPLVVEVIQGSTRNSVKFEGEGR